MPPLNPFLRAFLRSTLPPQCSPVHQHVLLVPTTEVLLTSRDRETQALYSDLASSEDFLASHVLRVHTGAGGTPLTAQGKEVASFRETRTKAKQFTTLNGRTVIIKDSFIYSNKGFKSLNQAQLLSDALYYPDAADAQPWLVYHISRPLVGIFDAIVIVPATLDMAAAKRVKQAPIAEPSLPKKKDVKSFSELLNNFPMIAKQMQPGLEKLFREFAQELEKPLPPTPSSATETGFHRRANSASSGDTTLAASFHSGLSNGSVMPKPTIFVNDEEDTLRKALETAVTAAIDLFQMVDKQQLSQLGATTELTGPVVERMIERYISEQVHDTLLFARICASRKAEDADLEGRIRQMTDIDISQVGIDVQSNSAQRRELSSRLSKAATLFKRTGVASSPQETTEILLATLKVLSENDDSKTSIPVAQDSEKHSALLTVNADTLVSMLLVVVIRSSVRHLNARLSYMHHFTFIDDVDSGELGYALSTFEAVLTYLTRDSAILRKASRTNRRVWDAAKCGDLRELRRLLETEESGQYQDSPTDMRGEKFPAEEVNGGPVQPVSFSLSDLERAEDAFMDEPADHDGTAAGLQHVFPFQRTSTPDPFSLPKRKKRVSVASCSTSSSSVKSFHTRTDSLHSRLGELDTELSGPALSRTHSADGESLLMMAVENVQPGIVDFLTSWHAAPPLSEVFDDTNNDGTTLLSAAVQTGRAEVANAFLDFILEHPDIGSYVEKLASYVAQPDAKGRSAAHYLFNTPRLIAKLGNMLPWTLKDRNGQTPLFALCRSYDHDDYRYMVETALSAATKAQARDRILHVDEHIDGKGNTLLHIVNDPEIISRLLQQCDSDVNAANDKHFTPLMVASKYGRTDTVRILFADPRVDIFSKDLRGLTAVELAKDDEIRNRIDDLVLLSTPPTNDGRITAVVRSFFVEDGTVRLILKSGAPNLNSTVTVTTSRRTPSDFESLNRWLALELPASWLPALQHPQSPFLIPSKPSRALLRDMQLKLDSFLHILLAHPTFSTHEMVWEFFLVPDMNPAMLAERAKKKAETRAEMVRDEYEPLTDVREVELFVSHAKESVRGFHHAARSVLRRVNRVRHSQSDFVDAAQLCKNAISTLVDLPQSHIQALERFTKTLTQTDFSPYSQLFYSVTALQMTTTAVLHALNRPSTLIGSMSAVQKSIDKHMQSLRRSDRWPLGLLDDTRHRLQKDAQDKADKSLSELRSLGQELRYTQQTIAGELAGWQDEKAKMGRRAVKELARRMVVIERDRLESMKRAIRGLGVKERPKRPVPEVVLDEAGPSGS